MRDLKDCPFCGSDEVDLWAKGTRYGAITYAECALCGAKSKAFTYSKNMREEFDFSDTGAVRAVHAWNRRAHNAQQDN